MSDTHVLVIESEPEVATLLEQQLRTTGYEVRITRGGGRGLELATADPVPDLVILDLVLPDVSGTDICRRLRNNARTRDVMILICSARCEEIDRIISFEVGADDFVAKPFSTRELLLRVRGLLRFRQRTHVPQTITRVGVITVDRVAHRVYVGDYEVVLTLLEFKVLIALIANRERVQTREAILDTVWDGEVDVTTRTVDTHVRRLRGKLGVASSCIKTIRGVGYRFSEHLER